MGGLALSGLAGGTRVWADENRKRAVPYYRQRHTLSCEMTTLRMAASYFGRELSEELLVRMLEVDESPLRLEDDGTMIWGDPDKGFVGSIDGKQIYHDALKRYPPSQRTPWQWGYGVYTKPIAQVATRIGLYTTCLDSIDDVYRHLDRGHPVIALVPHAGKTQAKKWSWYTEKGDEIPVINGEHAVVLRPGYDGEHVGVNDPTLYPEDRVLEYAHEDFAKAFSILSMAVAIGKPRYRTTPPKIE